MMSRLLLRPQQPQVAAVPGPSQQKKRKPRRRRRAAGVQPVAAGYVNGGNGAIAGALHGDGSCMITRSEMLTSVTISSGQSSVTGISALHPSSFSWLKGIARSYEQIVWLSAVVEWRSACATSTQGSLVIGVDWTKTSALTREQAQALVPNLEVPVWGPARTLKLPSQRLMTRRAYNLDDSSSTDKQPGSVAYVVTASRVSSDTFMGDIWVHYRVKLMGPKPA